MVVTVNGETRELPAGATIANVVASLGVSSLGGSPSEGPGGRGVAVALAGAVVPRSAWAGTQLCDGARVEVLAATQGG